MVSTEGGAPAPYDQEFFLRGSSISLESARLVVPFMLDIARPKKVVDVGCGVGAWLRVFQQNGVPEIRGLDGDYVDASVLLIDKSAFTPTNLERPFRLDETFDLALSLEVGEHLPRRCAGAFIESLTRLAPLIFFSAAIPGQGGTHHVNEQWPTYWENLFLRHDFLLLDALRPSIWQDHRIDMCYRQNTFLYARKDRVEASPSLKALADQRCRNTLTLIDAGLLDSNLGISLSLRRMPGRLGAAIRRKFGPPATPLK